MRIQVFLIKSFVLSVALICCLAACQKSSDRREEIIPRVKVYTVNSQATGQKRRISGKVNATDKSTLSFGVSGKIIEVLVKKGDTVTQGQLLAKLDEKPFQLIINEARAKLSSNRAELVKAQAAYDRTSRLFKEDAASKKDFDTIIASLAKAKGTVESSKSTLQQFELDFQRTSLIAPFAGKVVDVPIDSFQEIAANGEVIVLQSNDALEIEVRVPETLIREIEYGQVVEVTFPTIKEVSASGVVTSIGAETESGNAFPVVVSLSTNPGDVRPGMTASVTFNFRSYLDDRTAYLIPLSAIAIEAGLAASENTTSTKIKSKNEAPVYVYRSDLKIIELRNLIVGDLQGNEIEVYEGLEPGDQVVSAGVAFLRDGMRAEIWKPRG